jgi:hypothetical protein
VERLNIPFGKQIRDKLYFLQLNGKVDETEFPVLDETHFNSFNMEVPLYLFRWP